MMIYQKSEDCPLDLVTWSSPVNNDLGSSNFRDVGGVNQNVKCKRNVKKWKKRHSFAKFGWERRGKTAVVWCKNWREWGIFNWIRFKQVWRLTKREKDLGSTARGRTGAQGHFSIVNLVCKFCDRHSVKFLFNIFYFTFEIKEKIISWVIGGERGLSGVVSTGLLLHFFVIPQASPSPEISILPRQAFSDRAEMGVEFLGFIFAYYWVHRKRGFVF